MFRLFPVKKTLNNSLKFKMFLGGTVKCFLFPC